MSSDVNRLGGVRQPLMTRRGHAVPRLVTATILLFLVIAPRAQAATWFVADTGTDGGGCGVSSTTPCRSISRAIANAIDGDTISVARGRYGDLNRNGVLGEAGEENGPPGCSCMLLIDKAVIVISIAGAAATLIDARTVEVFRNVMIADDGVQFGRAAKGFTVTQTQHSGSDGIVIAANSVMVRGNQVLFFASESFGRGIHTGNQLHSVRIEGNLVTDWSFGIDGGPGVTVSKNQVVDNGLGIAADGGHVVANVVSNNFRGIQATATVNVTGNAVYGNDDGFFVSYPFLGAISRNNVFGNQCGLRNAAITGLNATNNYWGAPTGPGAGAADTTCEEFGGTTDVTPFATKPFVVTVLKP